MISKVDIDWQQAFDGFVPCKNIFQANGLYTAVGILGATNMPHIFFLGSALATQNRVADTCEDSARQPSVCFFVCDR